MRSFFTPDLQSMRSRLFAALLLSASVAFSAQPVIAQTGPTPKLFINTGPDPYTKYQILRYQGRDWQTMTSLLQSSFDITTGASLPSLAALTQFDALWVDQRYFVPPSASDIATILGFAATGRRVVIIGENQSAFDFGFMTWSVPMVQALGGDQGPPVFTRSGSGCLYGLVNTVLMNALTAGVQSVGVGCAGFAIGGTALFDYNVATLWGNQLNVLTMLDANMLDDTYPVGTDGVQFQRNVTSWLSADVAVVPEPGTFVLLVPALVGVAMVVRRRRAV